MLARFSILPLSRNLIHLPSFQCIYTVGILGRSKPRLIKSFCLYNHISQLRVCYALFLGKSLNACPRPPNTFIRALGGHIESLFQREKSGLLIGCV